MDLLGDIGTADQLTASECRLCHQTLSTFISYLLRLTTSNLFFHDAYVARSENAVLKERIKQLEEKCSRLTVENETLKAEKEALKVEVEIYRQEAGGVNGGGTAGATMPGSGSSDALPVDQHFVQSGDGTYPSRVQVSLERLHGVSNILTCSLSQDDSILATGGADSKLSLVQWGRALKDDSSLEPIAQSVVESAVQVPCPAPVIVVDFARHSLRFPLLAAGCMDGSVNLIHYDTTTASSLEADTVRSSPSVGDLLSWKHGKYIKSIAWSPTQPIVATASADGNIRLHKVVWNPSWEDISQIKLESLTSLQLPGPVETIAFVENCLFAYARGTPYLSYFDLDHNMKQTQINLNQGSAGTAGFDEHVSFAVMDMAKSCDNDKYLALATDTSRNVVLDWKSQQIVRNLYGHQNDGYSTPKVAWSMNGQYIMGNTQDDSKICVWDIATSSIVERLQGPHTQSIRDLYSSPTTNTLVTTSFDKTTNVWFPSD